MIKATIVSGSKAILKFGSGNELDLVQSLCKFKNKSLEFQYRRHLKNQRWKSYDFPGWEIHKNNLKSKIEKSILFEEDGQFCIRPGFLHYIKDQVEIEIINDIKYPSPRPYPYYKKLEYTPYPYQTESVEKLIQEKHGNVELTTGSGKSLILLMIAQKLGLKTIVVTPSASIFEEIVEKFSYHFGPSMIGMVGNGKKKFGKNITICISDSLVNLKEGTKEYEEISSAQVLLADESHTIPAETLEKVCHGVLKDIPYRFFLSGTQTRGDGTEKMLHAIIGKTVHRLNTEEAIKGGYICDHIFKIVPIDTTNLSFYHPDALEMKRFHFLNNPNIADFIAKLATAVAQLKNESTLILIDELSQVALLSERLKIPYAIATSAEDKISIASTVLNIDKGKFKKAVKAKKMDIDNIIDSMTESQKNLFFKIKDSDPTEAVEKFNKGEVKILIGTSCISTGTNIFPTHHTFNWQGGTSEIRTKQGAVGRSVRKLENSKYANLHPPKPKSIIYDFFIKNVEIMARHLKTRLKFYKTSGVMIEWIGGIDFTKFDSSPENDEDITE